MTLTDLQLREAAENIPVVKKVGVDAVRGSVFARAEGVYACLWNEKTGEVLSVDDVDVGEGFVVAIAIGVKDR